MSNIFHTDVREASCEAEEHIGTGKSIMISPSKIR